jgi:methyltransferase family protein
MTRKDFLSEVHRAYHPTSYFEIGIGTGRSLGLSRTRTIAVDPAFKIKSEIRCDIQVVKATSDDFFARDKALTHFPNGRIDLAFVDGLHLFEFALRDFMNVERHAAWTSVIVVDDVLPRNVIEASRERSTTVWAGDVFKLVDVLGVYRPDLLLLSLDTDPTGLLLVLGADPDNKVLDDRYDEIVEKYVQPDPQPVPAVLLRRETAIDPASIVDSDLWSVLRNARESGLSREAGWDEVRRAAERATRPAKRRELTSDALRPLPPTLPERALAAVRRRLRPVRKQLRRRVGI